MKNAFDPRRLDVRHFAELGADIGADQPLADCPRLLEETQGRSLGERVAWVARGELVNPGHVHPQVWLHLRASTRLSLQCQRCLQPVDVDLSVQRAFRFAPDEAAAAAQDEDSEEDVLAESRSFDLLELLEDELLLELPLVPRHEVCPEQLPAAVGQEEFEAALGHKESPFEVLRGLGAKKR